MTIGGYKSFCFVLLPSILLFIFFLYFFGCSFEVNELLTPGSWIDTTTTLGAKGTLDLIALG